MRKFKCEESFCKLLSAWPVLEDLFFEIPSDIGRLLFSISVPSELALYYRDDPRLEINTPLKSLTLAKDMPKLVEANVKVNLSKSEKLMKVVTSVEHLTLDLYPSMVFHLTDRFISNRLLRLELDIYDNFQSYLLLHLLKDLPNIRALKFNYTHPNYKIKDQPCSVSKPIFVRECLSFHLQTLKWIGYGGIHEEKETAVCILKNALRLKNATISLHTTGMENDMIMMKELESMSKASISCQLVIRLSNSS